MSEIPRPEHPRPQFVRDSWLSLNGSWEFEIDARDDLPVAEALGRQLRDRITVPFCPESSLSGIGNTDFMPAVWYRRQVRIPAGWDGRRVLLHFQAVDYDATVWVDGIEVKRHRGGFTPFTCDLGERRGGEELEIVLRARDHPTRPQPRGKQSRRAENYRVYYTRTTGIWQTVWLEAVSLTYLARARLTPRLAERAFWIEQPVIGSGAAELRAVLSDASGDIAEAATTLAGDFSPALRLEVPSGKVRPWSPRDPYLYDLRLELLSGAGEVIDTVASYCGLRGVSLRDGAFLLNGERLFQRLVLDQGYWADGIMTAPSDEALRRDIELGLEAGFNGARLHQKVFEERYLYHADRLGYLVWGEFGDWGCREEEGPPDDHQRIGIEYAAQWLEALERDYSHPSIVGWCPLNETWQAISDRITDLDGGTRALFLATKAMDLTRPVLDASGYSHREPDTDVWDSHDYEQDPAAFAEHHRQGRHVNGRDGETWSLPRQGQPYFVSEFGGAWWSDDSDAGWGYGSAPKTREEFLDRFGALAGALLDNPDVFGYCYTQLTDVFQEQNGLYTFDRRPKFDAERLRAAQERDG